MIGNYAPSHLAVYRPLPKRAAVPLNLISGPSESPVHGIYEGDCRTLGKLITDNSVDAIICDPVYQLIWQYAWLARFAARVLKPGRSVVAQAGHIHCFEAEVAMECADLVRRPVLHEIMTGGFGRNWMHKAFRTSQPFIWLTKTDESPYNYQKLYHKWVRLTFYGSKDKKTFSWGDGERAIVYLIECLTQPGDLVLDPFSGTGTVAAVCAKMGRRYISFELDPGRVQQSRKRLENVQMPLFQIEPQHEQGAMFGESVA